LSGQKETGVSIMQIVAALDEGDLLSQVHCPIDPQETNQTLTNKLITLSNQELRRVIPDYLLHKVQPCAQPMHPSDHPFALSYSRKLTKADGQIDWQKPAAVIEREVRAFAGWPSSYTEDFFDRRIIITKARIGTTKGTPGTLIQSPHALEVTCGTGSLVIGELKPAGKPAMSVEAFLRGVS
jgi:methionyl-tRNA formyltransferase